ncbi:choice-of-anchor L domain-containing protein [Roseovarius sp. EL26]|uniref:choice-of-anchor L domain-containing protein n=1 Tax=Roseovarius sp. EL26 TaxID=2126672 RepID=UPI000EA180DC|nr:choice-of-anchor L domain-containing protein [Roseovarius sp. EL26]
MVKASELPIDTKASAMDMAQEIFGNGITIQTASYTGAGTASGVFSDGDNVAPGITPSDSGVILSTGKAKDVTNSKGDANVKSSTSTNQKKSGDDDLEDISGQKTYDASVFEASFTPEGSTLTMQVVFSSEEYLEYVDSGFNDAVGVWVNGEPAQLTVGTGDITINNINNESNQNLYVDNPASTDPYNTEMDGFTVTLTLKAPVNPDQINTIKIGIADGGDAHYDSNLLIAGGSVQTALVAEDDQIEYDGNGEFDLLANDSSSASSTLTITEINGQPVVQGDQITLPSGEVITLTENGIEVQSDGADDDSNAFSYKVEDEVGNTDIAFVTLNKTVPCFVLGTLIDTDQGPRPVEDVQPGDLIPTRDHGLQPVCWVGRRTVPATGRYAPIEIGATALGNHGCIRVSQQHRILLRGWRAELCCGVLEVLVKARHLINEHSIRACPGGDVTYVHLLFDQHEIVTTDGLESESLYPGPTVMQDMDDEVREEVFALFPELAIDQMGYGPIARPEARAQEARLITAPCVFCNVSNAGRLSRAAAR